MAGHTRLGPGRFAAFDIMETRSSTSVSGALRYNNSKSFEDFAMLTNEMKRQAFMKLRTENYRASLRLEGLTPRPGLRRVVDQRAKFPPKWPAPLKLDGPFLRA